MDPYSKLIGNSSAIEKRLGYVFSEKKYLLTALTHRSFINENRDLPLDHNERLEFLGDSVLGLLVSDYLFQKLPTSREGGLSHLRAGLVDANSCAAYLEKLDVFSFVLLGKGEVQNDGRGKTSIHADLFEAIIGAIYLDGGLESAKKFFISHFEEDLEKLISKPQKNWKALLQDYAQKKYQRPPVYEVIKEEGPDHLKIFFVIVRINEKQIGEGEGSSKKKAEQVAAQNALEKGLENYEG